SAPFSSKCPPAPRPPPSSPPRRSSDLPRRGGVPHPRGRHRREQGRLHDRLLRAGRDAEELPAVQREAAARGRNDRHRADAHRGRSEEHTSELQSLTNLVCRLLLEKKNT